MAAAAALKAPAIDVEIRRLGEHQERKMKEVAKQRGDAQSEPGAGDAADHDPDQRR